MVEAAADAFCTLLWLGIILVGGSAGLEHLPRDDQSLFSIHVHPLFSHCCSIQPLLKIEKAVEMIFLQYIYVQYRSPTSLHSR